MRVTSPPATLLIAAALAVMTLLAHPSSAGAERWQRPVPGEVTRSFHYSPATPFASGAHRGADLAAVPGDPVRAACAGVVVHAGPMPGGASAVTVRCGDRRVTHLPLRRPAVRRGVRIAAGARIGTLAPGHGGLHVGVRTASDAFGYVDPLPLLPAAPDPTPTPTPPLAARPQRPSTAPGTAPIPHPSLPPFHEPARAPIRHPSLPPSHRPPQAAITHPSMPPFHEPARAPITHPSMPSISVSADSRPDRPLAPPLAWAGLALAALATTGTGALITRRRARAATRATTATPALRP
jgi:hypothetical protein